MCFDILNVGARSVGIPKKFRIEGLAAPHGAFPKRSLPSALLSDQRGTLTAYLVLLANEGGFLPITLHLTKGIQLQGLGCLEQWTILKRSFVRSWMVQLQLPTVIMAGIRRARLTMKWVINHSSSSPVLGHRCSAGVVLTVEWVSRS